MRRLAQVGCTFVLATIAWVFFKASTLEGALAVLGGMLRGPLWVPLSMGLNRWDLLAVAAGLLLLLLVDLRSVNHSLTGGYLALPRPGRWAVLWVLLFACLIFGSYGTGYDAQSFLYGFSF